MIAKGAPGLEEPVKQISHAVVRLNRMVQDLLDLSRLEVRRMPSIAGASTPRLTAAQLVSEGIGRPLDLRGHTGRCSSTGTRRIAQVLENLVSNALKYGEDGTPIVVDLEAGECEVTVAVTDHGMRIDPTTFRGSSTASTGCRTRSTAP